MQHKYQKRLLAISVRRGRGSLMLVALLYGLVLFVPLAVAAHTAFADGDADLTLTPDSGTVSLGAQVMVTLSESSPASDNTNIVDAIVLYDSNLQYVSSSQGSFGSCDIETPDSGEVDMSCVTGATVSGTLPVATITFSALSAGSPNITLDPGSDVQDDSGNDIWDGTIPVAAFTINAPGASSSGSGGGAAGPGGAASGSSGGGSAGSTGGGAPAGSSNAQSSTSTKTGSASLKLIVTDHNGKPLKGATVRVDNHRSILTNSQGTADFSGLAAGAHTIAVSMSGKVTSTTAVTLSTGESKSMTLKLANQSSSTETVAYVCVGLTILAAAGYLYRKKHGYRYAGGFPHIATPGIVVGSGTPASVESPNPVPTVPVQTQSPLVSIPKPPVGSTVTPTKQHK